MYRPHHVYLRNRHFTNLVVELALKRSAAPATLRKDATTNTSVTMKPTGIFDVTEEFGLDRQAALALLQQSPMVTRWKDHYLEVVDVDTMPPPPEMTEEQKKDVPLPSPVTPPSWEPPKQNQTAFIRAQTVAAAKFKEEGESGEPSITWKRDKLAQHAMSLGIKVTPTMSKAAILRAIRQFGQ